MIVTEIYPVTKKKCRVILEGELSFALYQSELSRYGICQGEPIAEEALKEIMESVLPLRAKKYAMNLLISRDRTEKELRDKLRTAGYPDAATDEAVTYVKSYGYINDERYARHYLEIGREKESFRQLSRKLVQKGVPVCIVEKAAESIPWEENSSVLIRRLIEKKLKGRKPENEKTVRNVAAYLGRRGFSGEEIWPVLREYLADL
ncbi:MAG: regulatory protein RecX [Ruminococcus sp.]|jgi:regulatory protein